MHRLIHFINGIGINTGIAFRTKTVEEMYIQSGGRFAAFIVTALLVIIGIIAVVKKLKPVILPYLGADSPMRKKLKKLFDKNKPIKVKFRESEGDDNAGRVNELELKPCGGAKRKYSIFSAAIEIHRIEQESAKKENEYRRKILELEKERDDAIDRYSRLREKYIEMEEYAVILEQRSRSEYDMEL